MMSISEDGVEVVQGDDLTSVVFLGWMLLHVPWVLQVLTIALLKNRVYVKHHKVLEEHPLYWEYAHQGCIGTPCF